MAVYVKMIKKFDDEKRVVYQFGPNENQMLLQSKSDLKSWLVKAGDKKKGFSLESKKRMMMQKR